MDRRPKIEQAGRRKQLEVNKYSHLYAILEKSRQLRVNRSHDYSALMRYSRTRAASPSVIAYSSNNAIDIIHVANSIWDQIWTQGPGELHILNRVKEVKGPSIEVIYTEFDRDGEVDGEAHYIIFDREPLFDDDIKTEIIERDTGYKMDRINIIIHNPEIYTEYNWGWKENDGQEIAERVEVHEPASTGD